MSREGAAGGYRWRCALLVAAVLLLSAGSSSADPPGIVYGSPATYAVGTTPVDAAAADFNGDGAADVVVADRGSGDVSVLLNRGDGTLNAAASYPARGADGSGPSYVTTADFNGDGLTDIATDGAVLLGAPDGGFEPELVLGSGTSVAAADLNRDGKDDLVVTGSDVTIRLGYGDGTFRDPVSYPAGSSPSAVAVADVNEDAVPDLAVAAGGGNAVTILIGSGDGSFAAPRTFSLGAADPTAVTAGDVNGDGHVDLAVARFYAASLSVLQGNGPGDFSAQTTLGVCGHAADVQVADLNGDGYRDLVTSSFGSNEVVAFANNGDGTFAAPARVSVPSGPDGLAVGDFDTDGHGGDVAVAEATGDAHAVAVLSNRTPSSGGDADVEGDVKTIISVQSSGSVRFPPLGIGQTSDPVSAPVRVITNDKAGYQLLVSRTPFSGGDIPLSIRSGPVPSGMGLDLAGLTPIPTSGAQPLGHRTESMTGEAGDLWPTSLVLGPVGWTSAGTHKATVIYTVVGF